MEPRSDVTQAAPARVRRLANVEIKNVLRDIFDLEIKQSFPSDLQRHDFDNQFDVLGFTSDFASSLQAAAEEVSAVIGERITSLLDCDPGDSSEATCAERYVDTIGRRLYRRPLTDIERAHILDLFAWAREGRDFATAIATITEAMIQSPQFTYRTEFGPPSGGQLATLSPYEVASWLSFGLWRSGPDDDLLDAAARGSLGAREAIETQAQRLLSDRRARAAWQDFVLQWLDMAEPEALRKADPAFTANTAASMIGETSRFFEEVGWNEAGSLEALLTANIGYPNAELARIYDVTSPGGTEFRKTELATTERAGFLTQPGFIAAHMPGGETSPISVGRFVRVALLCQPLPPPPAGIPEVSQEPSLTTRQRYAQHSSDARCSGCHQLIDPVGFGFERYDVMGRFRTTEAGMTLSGDGELHGSDVDGPFKGPVELANRLAESPSVRSCFAAHILKFMLGRDTASPEFRLAIDDASLERAVEQGRDGGSLDVRALMIALATSDAGLLRDGSNVSQD